MGAWGVEAFENDDAVDFASEVKATKDLSVIEQALEAVLSTPEYLEASVSSVGLAAADIVARVRGQFGQQDSYTAGVDAWVRTRSLPVDERMVTKARAVVERVRIEPSELLELWSEGDPAEWLAVLDALKERLSAPPVSTGGQGSVAGEKKGLLARLFKR